MDAVTRFMSLATINRDRKLEYFLRSEYSLHVQFPKNKLMAGGKLESNETLLFEGGDGKKFTCCCKKDFREFKIGETYEALRLSEHKMWRSAIRNWVMIRNPNAYMEVQMFRYLKPSEFVEHFDEIE